MGYIKFIDGGAQYNVVSISQSSYSANAVKVKFEGSKLARTGGFNYYIGTRKRPLGDYSEYKYVFKNDEAGIVEFSKVDEKYHEPSKDVLISASWNDNDDEDNIRPNRLNVIVTIDGEETGIVLDSNNSWKYTIYELPESTVCSVSIIPVAGYTSSISGTSITLNHEPVNNVKKQKKDSLKSDMVAAYQEGVRYDGVVYPYDSGLLPIYEVAVQTNKSVVYNGVESTYADLSIIYIQMEEKKIYNELYYKYLCQIVDEKLTADEINAIKYGDALDNERQILFDAEVESENDLIEAYIRQLNYANLNELISVEEAVVELYELIMMGV